MTRMLEELEAWWISLPSEFAFLAVLPFAVALAGLLACRTGGTDRKRGAPAGGDGKSRDGNGRIGAH